jgi:hypothetical protein
MKTILIIILYAITIYSQSGTIKGRVTEDSFPIPFANIVLLNTNFGEATDEDGFYQLNNIPAGNYSIRFSAIGFETKILPVQLDQNETVELDVKLKSIAIEVATVEVTGIRQQEQRDTRTSLIDLNPRDAKVLPGAVEDVFRTLQTLPGVLAPNDFSSQLIVRGSGPDQNLIVLDDVEVFNPYRLYGVISMFNPDAVEQVNLISGGFPSMYGDRLSAVLDVTNREGSTKKTLTGNLNASIVDANLVLEGKNPFDLRGSWLINSRRTYYDLIIEPFVKNAGLVDENTSFPNFYDIQGKFVIGPYKGHKFLFTGIISRDGVDVVSGEDRNTPDSIGVYNFINNNVASLAWHYAPSKKFFNKLIASWYINEGLTDFDSRVLDPSLNRDNFEEIIPDTLAPYLLSFSFNAKFKYRKYSIDDKLTYLWKDHIFEAGAGVDFLQSVTDFEFNLDPQLKSIISGNPQFNAVLSDLKDVLNYRRYRVYLQNNFKVNSSLFIQPSLRFDYYDILEKAYFAPRISLSYAFDQLTTLRLVWGLYYQSPGYEKLRDREALLDLRKEYTRGLNAERATHYVAGIERWLSNEWSIKLEGYYKDFDDLYIQKRVTGTRFFTEPVPGKDPRLIEGWTRPVGVVSDSATQVPINGSFGEAYGFELLLSKKNRSDDSKISGWISYSLAYANRYENGVKYPFRFDQRHTINIVLNYQVSSWFEVGLRWQYGSGFAISEPIGIKPRIINVDTNLDGIPDSPTIATRRVFGNPNADPQVVYDVDFGENKLNSRKPAYHRLDLRANFAARFWNLDWIFYLDVINVYNRKNVVGYDYYITEDLTLAREANNMFPILPTLGFSVKF